MKQTRFSLLLAAALFLLTETAHAAIFTVTNRTCTGCTLQAQTDGMNNLFNSFETTVNNQLSMFNQPDLTQYSYQFANASTASARGNSVDYGTDFSIFTVGFGLNAGAAPMSALFNLQGLTSGTNPAGLSLQTNAMLGLNLGILPIPKLAFFDIKKMKVFVNFFSFDASALVAPMMSGTFNQVTATTSSFGLHAQYSLVDGITFVPVLLNWGGLKLNTGVDVHAFNMQLGRTVTQTQTDPASLMTMSSTITPTVDVSVNTVTVPVEISTNVRVLYLLSLFAGVGVDFNFGGARLGVNTLSTDSIVATGAGVTATGTPTFTMGNGASPAFADLHVFFGPQINLALVHAFVQINYSVLSSAASVGGGVKISF